MPVVEEVSALLIIARGESPVIEDEEVGFGELAQEFGVGAVAASDGDVGQEPRDVGVTDGEAVAAGAVGDGTGEEGFTDAGRFGDEDVAAAGELGDERFVEPATDLSVEVHL